MTYTQDLTGCYAKDDAKAFIDDGPHLGALKKFRDDFKAGNLPPLSIVLETNDIEHYQHVAMQFADLQDILILGTGGSSLGGQALCALSSQEIPRLHFMDNVDPSTFARLFQQKNMNPKKTGLLVISKSGSTVETLMQLMVCLQQFAPLGLQKQHVIVITEPTANPLRKIAESYGWTCLDHHRGIGGRYACFSVVGLLPAILAGLDVHAFRRGAADTLEVHLTADCPPAYEGAALTVYLEKNYQKTQSVMFPYADQLDYFSFWYRQLWAESLGKNGKGTTPIRALGTVDQHSQLQLYLDGPKDKFFTMLTPNWAGQGDPIHLSHVPEFMGKTMGDLFVAEQKATYATLLAHKCPTRLITFERVDEYHLGALMMHFMLETIFAARILGIDAFDQPAVEQGKRLAREYLAR